MRVADNRMIDRRPARPRGLHAALAGLVIALAGCGGSGGSAGPGTGGAGGSSSGAGGATGSGGTTGAGGATGAGGTTGAVGAAGAGGTTGAAGIGGTAGTSGAAGTNGVAGAGGSAGTSGAAGRGGAGGTTGAAGSGNAGRGGVSGTAGRGGAGGNAGGTGGGGRGGGDCRTTPCPAGQICFVQVAGAAITSVGCVANPCAPAALACDCAMASLDRCNQLCSAMDETITCGTRCAAPDTPIATPSGERPIAALRAGDLVYSLDHGRMVAVPIAATQRTPAGHHHVARVTLDTGRVLMISPGHPTADGGTFAGLRARASLGDRRVTTVELVAYPHDFTYDILPDSDTGTYLAAGALIGSTLHRGAEEQRCAAFSDVTCAAE